MSTVAVTVGSDTGCTAGAGNRVPTGRNSAAASPPGTSGVGNRPHDAVVRAHDGQRPPGDGRVGTDLEHDVVLAIGGEGGLHLDQRAGQRQRIPRRNDAVAEVEPLPRLGERQLRPEQRGGHGDQRQHPAGRHEPSAARR